MNGSCSFSLTEEGEALREKARNVPEQMRDCLCPTKAICYNVKKDREMSERSLIL